MRKLLFWTTILSGAVAAYLMFKRGESFDTIASKATQHPFGALADELKRS